MASRLQTTFIISLRFQSQAMADGGAALLLLSGGSSTPQRTPPDLRKNPTPFATVFLKWISSMHE